MNKKIFIGSIIAVILLVLMSFSPSITANVSKPEIDTPVEEDVTPTPIVLVLQLITKLRSNKDIQNVETEDDVIRIIEGDEELNNIYEQLSVDDCGCDDNTPLEWHFPFICIVILGPLAVIAIIAWGMGGITIIGEIVGFFGMIFNCNWY